jgi:hypothetical protein
MHLDDFPHANRSELESDTEMQIQSFISKFNVLSDEERQFLYVQRLRRLYRNEGAGVRPLVRESVFQNRQGVINANGDPGLVFGVSYIDTNNGEKKIQVIDAPAHEGVLLKGLSLKEYTALFEAGETNLKEVSEMVGPSVLNGMLKLLNLLKPEK